MEMVQGASKGYQLRSSDGGKLGDGKPGELRSIERKTSSRYSRSVSLGPTNSKLAQAR